MLNCQNPAEDCISITDRKTDIKKQGIGIGDW